MNEDSTFNLNCSTGWTVDWDNPKIEDLYDRITDSRYTRFTYAVTKDSGHDWKGVGTEEFCVRLDDYIAWYNAERIKVSLGGMSPVQYRMSLGLI